MKRIILILSIIIALAMAGCSGSVVSSSDSAEAIVAKTLDVMARIKSYKMEVNIDNNYIINNNSINNTTTWTGVKTINLTDREMAMNMNIADKYLGSNLNTSLDMYIKDGKKFVNIRDTWSVTDLDDAVWRREIQMPYIIEILKKAIKISSLGSEKIDTDDYYVISITPSVQTFIDLIVAQEQPVGTQISTVNGGGRTVVRPDAYETGSIKIWVDKKSFLLLKVEINGDFQGNISGDTETTDTGADNGQVNLLFKGELSFSNYNRNVHILVPAAALSASK
jgi:outer membrane lipoprotein-sorting protein